MSKKKFDPKKYQDKDRVYPPVTGAPGVRRLWVWNSEKCEYEPPNRGKCYEARRYELNERGARVRRKQYFESLDEARDWMAGRKVVERVATKAGPLLSDVVNEWKKRKFSSMAESTQVSYEKIIRLYFGSLMSVPILALTPSRLDSWIDELKDPKARTMKSALRQSFDHELSLLKTILNYYGEYHGDTDLEFRSPVRARHWEAIQLNRPKQAKPKDLSLAEFLSFREQLSKRKHGEVLAALATIQFTHGLRISEAAALHWEDVQLNWESPSESRLRVCRQVCWPRLKGKVSTVKAGFKNGEANQGMKEHPLFPMSYEILVNLYKPGAAGLIFARADGRHFEYRQLRFAYDEAFKSAGLPYTATHVMRHGGTRRLLNETGDITLVQQYLGNSSIQSAMVYAKRNAQALTNHVKTLWPDGKKAV